MPKFSTYGTKYNRCGELTFSCLFSVQGLPLSVKHAVTDDGVDLSVILFSLIIGQIYVRPISLQFFIKRKNLASLISVILYTIDVRPSCVGH